MAFTTKAPFTTLGRLRSRLGNLAPQVGRFPNSSPFLGQAVGPGDRIGISEIGGPYHPHERDCLVSLGPCGIHTRWTTNRISGSLLHPS